MPVVSVLVGDELGYIRRCAEARDETRDANANANANNLFTVIGKFGALDRASSVMKLSPASCARDASDEARTEARQTVVATRRGGRVDVVDARSGCERYKSARCAEDVVHAFGTITERGTMEIVCVSANGGVETHGVGKDGDWRRRGAFATGENVAAADHDGALGRLVLGGKGFGNDVAVYDCREGRRVYKAKPPPANWLNYRAPPWVSATCFASQSECVRFFVGTGEHRFRHYDTREAKRAVLELDLGEGVITSVASSADGLEAYVANSRGLFEVVDLRAGRTRGKFRGNSGSIRQIAVHPDGTYVACAGLDQYVRVYDAKSRQTVASAYAKQALTSIVFDAYTPHVEAENARKKTKTKKVKTILAHDDDGNAIVKKLKKIKKRSTEPSRDDDDDDDDDDAPRVEKPKKLRKPLLE